MTATPILTTQRLMLRRPDASDTDAAVAFLMSERAKFVGGPVNLGKAWRAFASLVGHWDVRGFGLFTLVRKDTGQPVGMVGPWYPGDWPEPELSWSIWDPAAEGKGYAYEAAAAVGDFLIKALGWKSAVSYIDLENTRSIALAKRLGADVDLDAKEPFEDEGLVYRHHFGKSIR